jgi:hypothetical protein
MLAHWEGTAIRCLMAFALGAAALGYCRPVAADPASVEVIVWADPHDARVCIVRPGASACERQCHDGSRLALSPGRYQLAIAENGGHLFQLPPESVELQPGDRRELVAHLKIRPLPRLLGWVATVAGFGAVVGVGADSIVRAGGDPNKQQYGTAGVVTMIVGAVLGLVGVGLLVAPPKTAWMQVMPWQG